MADMSIADQLVFTTMRIECYDSAGNLSSGSGFRFDFCEEEDRNIPALVTNKHVIEGATSGVVHLHTADEDGHPIAGEHVRVPINNFRDAWVLHPDPHTDLAVMPLAGLYEWAFGAYQKKIFYKSVGHAFLATSDDLAELSAGEDIFMIGYPNGLWDSKNNLPIVRRGITATPPKFDFEGRKEFVIDCACFPGSSGSPVFLFNSGAYTHKDGSIIVGGRLKLLGVLYAGPQHTAQGEIHVRPVPTKNEPIALSRIPNNLGYCIKAEQLLAFDEHFREILATASGDES